MASKRRAKGAAGALAATQTIRSNEYIQKLLEDDELREKLRDGLVAARVAYERIDGKGPVNAVMDDRKTQKQLKTAGKNFRDVAYGLRGRRKRGRRGALLLLLLLGGGGAAVGLNEGLRSKVLDLIFGAEEEFEYSSSTTPATTTPATTTPASSGDSTPSSGTGTAAPATTAAAVGTASSGSSGTGSSGSGSASSGSAGSGSGSSGSASSGASTTVAPATSDKNAPLTVTEAQEAPPSGPAGTS